MEASPMNTALDFEIDDMPQLSLDDLMQVRAPWTYLVKIEGESMQGIGMYSGDLLVVDRSVKAKHGDIVIAAVNGEPLCKRMCHEHGVLVLRSENPKYPSRYIMEGDTFEVWGVVRFSVRDHDRGAG
ncbi:S24 family peptidase [Pseudomonas fulva]|uniref:LexA family protein n=1 Tax=Pseudomonas fulva TaxID=47880 RepID=UPI0015F7436F|nr:S24 family peptidase [Pseudomonas fulva]